jgi:hypothetical protein
MPIYYRLMFFHCNVLIINDFINKQISVPQILFKINFNDNIVFTGIDFFDIPLY